MRFGKKSRNLAAAGRRFLGERAQPLDEAPDRVVETLEPTEDEENAMTPPPPEESMVAGDPTQRLLTSLGRFQRQVTRAEEGTPQDSWCDECMNQLITGIEIALNEDWADVKEALTDTARVLQTYEDAGRADQCVYFLKDSYEILCLMVGDLIVGNVRSGVLKKWQERYERALDELADAGLTLVDDDSPVEREGVRESEYAADPADVSDDFDAMLEEREPASVPPSVFDGGLGPEPTGGPFGADPFAALAEDGADAAADSPFQVPVTAGGDAESLPSLDELLGRPVTEEDDLEDAAAGAAAPELSDDFTAESDEEAAERDEVDAEPEEPMADDAAETVVALHDTADELDFGGAPDSEAAEEPAETVPERTATEEEFEAAGPEPEPELKLEPQAAAAAEPEAGTPEALLRTAQRAMAEGNVGDAKVFALQLAANMAKLEAQQVEARAELIEKDIEVNSDAVTAAELAVNEAESRVRQLEEQVANSQKEFEEKRQRINALRDEVASVEGSVEDLDRQIAELEARRDEETKRLQSCQTNLDDSLNEESRLQSEIESLSEEEAGSRENLDGAREHVKALQGTGSTHAAALEATQAELEKRRGAVADIEKTIRYVTGEPGEPEGPPAGEAQESGERVDEARQESGE